MLRPVARVEQVGERKMANKAVEVNQARGIILKVNEELGEMDSLPGLLYSVFGLKLMPTISKLSSLIALVSLEAMDKVERMALLSRFVLSRWNFKISIRNLQLGIENVDLL